MNKHGRLFLFIIIAKENTYEEGDHTFSNNRYSEG